LAGQMPIAPERTNNRVTNPHRAVFLIGILS
jgi:hypothetical protein